MRPSSRTRSHATGRVRSRRGEGERLRDEILTATQRLLMETGSQESVSIRAVAQAVGVTPPAIYRHFADKDMLLLAACKTKFDELSEALLAEDPALVPLPDRMAHLGRAYIQFAIEHPESYRIMFMSRYELSAQEYAEEMMSDSCLRILLDTVTDLIDNGLVRPDLAAKGPLHVGALFWATVHGLASLFIAKPGLPWPDRQALVDDLIDLSVGAIQIP